jgi:serine/threonine protein kinase
MMEGEGVFVKIGRRKDTFKRENEMITAIDAALLSPHILRHGKYRALDGSKYYVAVMEACGVDLFTAGEQHAWVRDERCLLRVCMLMCAAVARLHALGIIHNDIKLENFLVCFGGAGSTTKAWELGCKQHCFAHTMPDALTSVKLIDYEGACTFVRRGGMESVWRETYPIAPKCLLPSGTRPAICATKSCAAPEVSACIHKWGVTHLYEVVTPGSDCFSLGIAIRDLVMSSSVRHYTIPPKWATTITRMLCRSDTSKRLSAHAAAETLLMLAEDNADHLC